MSTPRLRPSALATRNLFRNRRRSLATLLSIVFGALAILLFGGYAQSIRLTLETNIVRGSGHLQVQHPDFFLFGSGNVQDYALDHADRITQALRADPVLSSKVTMVSPLLSFSGVAGHFSAGLSKTVLAHGSVVADQRVMRQWNDYRLPIPVQPPKLLGTSPDAAVIGYGVARMLQLCNTLVLPECPRPTRALPAPTGADTPAELQQLAGAGSAENGNNSNGGLEIGTGLATAPAPGARLELLAATSSGAPNVAELVVASAERQGVRLFDDTFVGMHLAAAQRLVFRSHSNRATAVLVQLAHLRDLEPVRQRIQALLQAQFGGQALVVQDFRTLNPNFAQTVAMFDAIFGFISVLIAVIVLFTVGNTMGMAVVERTVEIGTLRAMGLRRAGLRRIFVTEGLLLGLVGALAGLLLALALAEGLELLGLTWLPPGYVDPMPLSIKIWGEWTLIGCTVGGLTLMATVSAWWPARHAARLEIVEALRHV